MATNTAALPPSGEFILSVRASCRAAREASGVQISDARIRELLFSSAFTSSFARLSRSHGVAFPLNFPSTLAELNFLSILALLNFGSGYRSPLRASNGRGAYDNIRGLLFGAYLSDADTFFSAKGMAAAQESAIAELMGVPVHVERPHHSIVGVTVGELGGPLYDFVKLVTTTLKETGEVLLSRGCPDLGTFVMQCLQEAEKAGRARGEPPDAEVALERLVRAIPAFVDVALVKGQPVYLFKKALFLLHAIQLRFGNASGPSRIPTVNTAQLPVYADNVLPSMLVHLGVIDLRETRAVYPGLANAFPAPVDDGLLEAGTPAKPHDKDKASPAEGPVLSLEEATVLRAAAVDACERIVEVARSLSDDTLDEEKKWISSVTLPEVDGWLWSVAKDRDDYRQLPRFSLRNTVFF